MFKNVSSMESRGNEEETCSATGAHQFRGCRRGCYVTTAVSTIRPQQKQTHRKSRKCHLELVTSSSTIPLAEHEDCSSTSTLSNDCNPCSTPADETNRLTAPVGTEQKPNCSVQLSRKRRSTKRCYSNLCSFKRLRDLIHFLSLDRCKRHSAARPVESDRAVKKRLFCFHSKLAPRYMALGAFLTFGLIIGAYFLGRFLTCSAADCPLNGPQSGRNGQGTISVYHAMQNRLYTVQRPDLNFTMSKSNIVRLPRQMVPMHYDMHIDLTEVHLKRINCTLRIFVKCVQPTNNFLLHTSREHLWLQKMTLTKSGVREKFVRQVRWNYTTGEEDIFANLTSKNDKTTFIHVTMTEPRNRLFSVGAVYELNIVYSASICDRDSGVKCHESDTNELDQNGNKAMYISTKFEPIAARTFLPCFDEPDLKATFNVSVTRPPDMTVVTNGPLSKKVRSRRGQVTEYFESTPPMSTYLFGFIAGRYVRQETRTDRGVKVSVWTRREDRAQAEYARDFAARMLNTMEHYFTITYPMSKLDLVASPDYPAMAMENWGLLIFQRRVLLYEHTQHLVDDIGVYPNTYIQYLPGKFETSKVIVHELVHQWFGNLVTMRWWSEIWLNEGFATFFIYRFLVDDFPVMADFFEMWKLLDTLKLQSVFEYDERDPRYRLRTQDEVENDTELLDTLDTVETESRRLKRNVTQPFFPYKTAFSLVRNFSSDSDIYTVFDEHNLYSKGGSVVRMLWHLLGEEITRTGLIKYLNINAYKSVDRFELWRAVESIKTASASRGRDGLGELMESWLINPGFPEVTVTRNNPMLFENSQQFTLVQRPADSRRHCAYLEFLGEESKLLWSVPFVYMIEENPLRAIVDHMQGEPFWLTNRTQTFREPALTPSQWLLVNPEFHFPYRINYDLDNWSKLTTQLRNNHDKIPTKSRAQLIVDGSFFLKDTSDLTSFLDLLGYLRKETELLPLILGLRELASLLDQYKGSPFYALLTFYFRPVVEQASKIRMQSVRDAETDGVWWFDESFELNLRVLQCISKNRYCHIGREEVQSVLSLPVDAKPTEKFITICEFLKANITDVEKNMLLFWLDQQKSTASVWNGSWRHNIVYAVGCVRDAAIVRLLVEIALAKKDLALLSTTMSSLFTLNYNDLLATEVWTKMANMTRNATRALYGGENEEPLCKMLSYVRTLNELELAKRAVQNATSRALIRELNVAEARLLWQQRTASNVEQWLIEKLELNE